MKTIYRIEHKDTSNGMWYNVDGSYNGVIKSLTEGLSKMVPMGNNQKCPLTGNWHSGVEDLGQLLEWFSASDILELVEQGYRIYKFKCNEYYKGDNEVYFTRKGVASQVEVSINDVR